MSRLLPSLPDATPDDRDPRVVGVDEDDADGGASEFDTAVESVTDPLVDHAVSLFEPGIVFFLGAALVFTLAWAYWYRTAA